MCVSVRHATIRLKSHNFCMLMSLDAKDLSALSRLLDEALDLPASEIESWLAALPAENAHLLSRLRLMLADHLAGDGAVFLGSGPIIDDTVDGSVAREGELVGPFRLIREIGRGGMGAVWLAEKADGSLRREIALKLPRLAWGAGLSERMARERDIGAILVHPNIARLYDAGVDDRGRPYLALEYVDGVPLDTWCKTQAQSIPERLRLFLQIVRAVSYAHGRLVVHRDLKPTNILVSADGQVHLLDFGIAKLLDEAAGDERLTQEQGRVCTPLYASPEQLLGEVVTVASDVYSLGVLLFKLMTTQHPYRVGTGGLASLEVAILEGEAPLASSRIDDPKARHAVRGEIDAIVGKALKRQPLQRYATADALAQDIERYLKGERVLARADTMAYRICKVVKRHRSAFAASIAALAAILGAAGVSVVQAKRASDAAERARVVKEFVVDVFKINERGGSGNNDLRRLPAELLLERGAKLIETKFPGQPELQAELFGVVGGIFADMGANALAAEYSTQQVEALVTVGASLLEQAKATLVLAQSLYAQGRLADARLRAERVVALSEREIEIRAAALVLLARILSRQGDIEGSKRALARADSDFERTDKPTAAAARAASLKAHFLVVDNRFDEAIPLRESAIATALAAEGASSPTAIDIRLTLAYTFMVHDRPLEARPYREAALAALRNLGIAGQIRAAVEEAKAYAHMFSGMVPRQTTFEDATNVIRRNRDLIEAQGPLVPAAIPARMDRYLGGVYLNWGDIAKAQPLVDRSFAVLVHSTEELVEKWLLAGSQGNLSVLLGRHEEAQEFLADGIELRKRQGEGQHPWAAYDYMAAIRNLAMQGTFDEAEALVAAAPSFAAPLKGGTAKSAGHEHGLQKTLAAVKLERGDAAGAYRLYPWHSGVAPHSLPFDDMHLRGDILCAVGRRPEGMALMEQSLSANALLVYAHHPALARDRSVAGLCAVALGQRAIAASLATQARDAFEAQPGVSPYFKAPLVSLMVKIAG